MIFDLAITVIKQFLGECIFYMVIFLHNIKHSMLHFLRILYIVYVELTEYVNPRAGSKFERFSEVKHE